MKLMQTKTDDIIIKLLHYFIVEEGYNPVVLHGAKDEIWLEKLNGDYNIIRISSNYIHNNEQFDYDIYKTSKIMEDIRKKTMLFKISALNILINIGDNVEVISKVDNIKSTALTDIKSISKDEVLLESFPTIAKKTNFKEKGMELFMKITNDISEKNEKQAKINEDIFAKKIPIITYILISINVMVFLLMYIFGNGSQDGNTLIRFGANVPALIKYGQYYRLLTSMFLHIDIFHLVFNMYALYIIGTQVESFFGKIKYLIIYIISGIISGLLSMLFVSGISAGASGAIFGLLGALIYFGHHYRVYFGTVVKSQIIPIIIINLIIGFSLSAINNAAHIGGLIGGFLITMAVGIKHKSSKSEIINGIMLSLIFTGFLIFMGFFN